MWSMKKAENPRPRSRRFVSLLLVAAASTGCTATDHAGAPGRPTVGVLILQTRTLGTGAAGAFAKLLSESSAGRLQVEVRTSSHRELGSGSDDAILADVTAGKSDLGEVSIAAVERAGVRSLSPLTAPGLIATIDTQAALASSPLGAEMLDGVSQANVRGLAILPGPVQMLAAVGTLPTGSPSLLGPTFELVADSEAARQFIEALGATPVIDGKANTLEPRASTIDLSPTTVSTRGVASAGTLYGNVPLWPDSTVLLMNPQAYSGLSDRDRHAIDEAASRSTADVASLRGKTEAESLSVLCRSAWRVTQADPSLVAAVRSRTDEIARTMRSDPALGPLMADLLDFVARRGPSPPITCSTRNVSLGSVGDLPSELRGAWEAEVTQEALDAKGQGLTEQGLVGSWRMEVADGRLQITDPQGTNLQAAVTVSGDLISFDVDRGSIDQGLGERWRFRWSVFHNRLTLMPAPVEGLQKGPTSLVSQPFTRVR